MRRILLPPAHVRRDRLDNAHLRVVLASALSADANCVDVGANVGGVLEQIVRLAPLGRHIAFEPLPGLHARLVEHFPQVEVRCLALSNRSGEAEFTFVASHPGYSGFRERAYPGRERLEKLIVPVARLDDVLPPGYLPHMVKIDVEGAEREVLEGGLETLARARPLVVFEHGKGAADYYGTLPEQVWDLLAEGAGLRIFDLDGNGPYTRSAFAEAFQEATRWNYLARP